jgi:hypothetical protein
MNVTIQIRLCTILIIITTDNYYLILFRYDEYKQYIFKLSLLKIWV